jgi:hypothetical protein
MAVAPLAHIVQGAPLPTALGWGAAGLIAVGGAGIFMGRRTVMEVFGWAAFAVGFCGAGAVVAVTAVLPTSARIGISLAAPASAAVGSAVNVAVCGHAGAGGSSTVVAAPDGNNVLAVLIDGREAAIENTGRFALVLPAGRHQLRVELLTVDHHVFSPEVTADATVTVGGGGLLPVSSPVCPAAALP